MLLKYLVDGFGVLRGDGDLDIADIAYDSRKVVPSGLFFCVDGTKEDGHLYAQQATRQGAVALVVTRWLELPVAQVLVTDSREAVALISARFFDYPAKKIKIIGITGTKGKTSTNYLLEGIGKAWGKKVGLIGTIETRLDGDSTPAKLTTPNALDLQRLIYEMANKGAQWVIMEVAAHGLTYKRVEGIVFDAAVFTNLSRDHLDDYGTMENYLAAKQLLFTPGHCAAAAINADDPASTNLAQGVPIITYGIEAGEIYATDIELQDISDCAFTLNTPEGAVRVQLSIPGRFNVYNALAAACAARLIGVPLTVIAKGMASVQVPGRCELLAAQEGVTILRDYAHSPDSVAKVLEMLREFVKGRIITVVGCGGNRDPGKRPIMGRIAGELSDYTIITSDNPRREDPELILDAMESGIIPTGKPYARIENRREAIYYAMKQAQRGDILLIAGKGHETYQEIQGVRHPFDEKVVVAELLKRMEAEA